MKKHDRTGDQGLVALYEFDNGPGDMIRDTSGSGDPLDLRISDKSCVEWTGAGLRVCSPTIATSGTPAAKITSACAATNELTVEAWFTPGNLIQRGPARIISISSGSAERNLTIGQGPGFRQFVPATFLDCRFRTSRSDNNGLPNFTTDAGSISGEATHVVLSHSANGSSKLYVNGNFLQAAPETGELSNWDSTFGLHLGNEFGADRSWLGTFHLLAFYDRALSESDVQERYALEKDAYRSPGGAGRDADADSATEVPVITITEPSSSSQVGPTGTVRGTISDPSCTVYVLLHPGVADHNINWSQPKVTFHGNEWSTTGHFGSKDSGAGLEWEITAIATRVKNFFTDEGDNAPYPLPDHPDIVAVSPPVMVTRSE